MAFLQILPSIRIPRIIAREARQPNVRLTSEPEFGAEFAQTSGATIVAKRVANSVTTGESGSSDCYGIFHSLPNSLSKISASKNSGICEGLTEMTYLVNGPMVFNNAFRNSSPETGRESDCNISLHFIVSSD